MVEGFATYVLFLQGNKVYIGKCQQSRIDLRISEHFSGGENSSHWCKINKPLKRPRPIVYYFNSEKEAIDKETSLTFEYMKNFGVDNVRGSNYVTADLPDESKRLIMDKIIHDDGLCFKCFKNGHFAKKCQNLGAI